MKQKLCEVALRSKADAMFSAAFDPL